MGRRWAMAVALCGLLLAHESPATPLPSWLTVSADLGAREVPAQRLGESRLQALSEQGHGMVIESLRREMHLKATGEVVDRTTEVRYFLSEQGVQSSGDFAISVSPSLSTATIEAAYVATSSAERIPIEAQTIQVINAPMLPVFSDARWVLVPFRALTPGARAVLVTSVVSQPDRLPMPWGTFAGTVASVPVERFEFVVKWDERVEEPRLKSDDPDLKCDRGERSWTCQRVASPAFVRDPSLADPLDFVPHVAIGKGRDWQQIADSVRRIVDGQLGDTTSLKPIADGLVVGSNSMHQRAEAIHRFVADKIRYVAVFEGAGAIVPNPPRVTLERRFGDCKDKATLFIGLARQVGLEAYPVLIAPSRKRADKFIIPAGVYFDHMIVCVKVDDGSCLYVDPTMAFSPAGMLAPNLQGAVALNPAEANPQPRQINESRFVWDLAVEESNELGCDGTLVHHARFHIGGAGALAMRAMYGPMSTVDRTRTFVSAYRETLGIRHDPTVTFAGLDQPSASVTVEVDERIQGTVDLTSYASYIGQDRWLLMAALMSKVDEWPHDVQQQGVRLGSHATYKICPKLEAGGDGAELDFVASFGRLTRSYTPTDGGLEVRTTLELPRALLTPAEARKFMKLLGTLVAQSAVQFALVGDQAGPAQ